MSIVGLLIGYIAGFISGLIIMALCAVSGRAGREES